MAATVGNAQSEPAMKKAVHERYGSPEVVKVRDVAVPAPGDDEILVRIHAAAVTSTDTTFRKGASYFARLFTGLRKPKATTLGDAMAGEVVAVGKNVARFQTGQRVFGSAGPGMGAHADYIVLPQDAALAEMPAGLSFDEAAAIADGAMTALPFIRDVGKIRPGQKVLINGASGAIGTVAVQLAKHYGAEVAGVSSTGNVDLVKSLGADTVIDYRQQDFTSHRGAYDIVFDTVGKSSFGKAKRTLKDKGIYLTTVISPGILVQSLRTSMIGSKRAAISFAGLRKPADKANDLQFLAELIRAGKIRAVIDRAYPLSRIADAHAHVDTGHKKGNVLVTMV